ncbi:MAG: tRNA (adenosine(37)-N6)-dimethylallyltransferase MiaA [Hyphomicrobium sp.]|jgi:tRNA dimethylallyltransferase
MSDTRPILIAGPTASGKSALALRLAQALNGIVINADAMQVYRELRILTARPDEAEMACAPHALYGFVPGGESYSAGRYAADVARVLTQASREGRRPIIVGGTGLYFKTLVEGLSPMPAVPEDVRVHWRTRALEEGAGALYVELAARDPVMAERLAPTDTQRIVRALEVIDSSGTSLAEWQQAPRQPVLELADTIPLLVVHDRDELYRRIDARFLQMMDEGGLEEVMQLSRHGLAPDAPIMTALGVRPLLRHVAGELSREAAITAGQTETRQYAKRQLTWTRSNMIAWQIISAQEMQTTGADLALFIQSAN